MDLISIVHSLWRYKLFTIPVVVLTAIGALYLVKIKPPVYEATSSVLLSNPEAQASDSQIAANPSLRNVSPFNTFANYGDLDVVGNAVIELVTSSSAQPALISSGVDPGYQLALSTDYGNPPIIDITGVAGNPQSAVHSASALTDAVTTTLYQLQKREGVNPFYMVSAIQLVEPGQAYRSSSGKLRSIIAILAIGVLLLFVVISAADALEKRRSNSSDGTGVRSRLRPPGREYQGSGSSGEPVIINGSKSKRPRIPGVSRLAGADSACARYSTYASIGHGRSGAETVSSVGKAGAVRKAGR
jgi:capsular polysaccharide biosynthesis protein